MLQDMTDYYQEHFLEYHASTVRVDPASFLRPLADRLSPGAVVLDVGCGSGRDMRWLRRRGFRVTGFERCAGLAELARAHSGCRVIKGDFETFDFSTLSVDALVLVGALVHVPHGRFREVLGNILRALKSGGHALLTVKEGGGRTEYASGRVFYLWRERALRNIFTELHLIVVAGSRQVSKIRDTDLWLGYVLKKTGGMDPMGRKEMMKTIYTLSIECVWGAYLEAPFLRVVEVPSDMTLRDLHLLIQDLAGFDNDHLSTFYTANSLRGKKVWLTETGDLEDGHDDMDGGPLWDLALHDIYPLPKHKKLYYWFDFGDDWTFEIRRKGKGRPPASGVRYPRIIRGEGSKPEQYPPFE
jgi:SAM-dependent methyltransferase